MKRPRLDLAAATAPLAVIALGALLLLGLAGCGDPTAPVAGPALRVTGRAALAGPGGRTFYQLAATAPDGAPVVCWVDRGTFVRTIPGRVVGCADGWRRGRA